MSQLEIANDLNYIDKDELKNIEVLVEEEARLISGLRRSYQPENSEPEGERPAARGYFPTSGD